MISAKILNFDHEQNKDTDFFTQAIVEQIEAHGLNLDLIKRHSKLIKQATKESHSNLFRIYDTCRLDNGGVLSFSHLSSITKFIKSDQQTLYLAFVPAAGAASRYLQPFSKLVQALEAQFLRNSSETLSAELKCALEELRIQGALSWPLPKSLRSLLEKDPQDIEKISQFECESICDDLILPKALYPCVLENLSFLRFKDIEHRNYPEIGAQVFITPPNMSKQFEDHLFQEITSQKPSRENQNLETKFIEQGPSLSTIRFEETGRPFLDANEKISVVPAGHGALAELFHELKIQSPKFNSVFIRNIDNISGLNPETINNTSMFLKSHNAILSVIKNIRSELKKENLQEAAKFAKPLLDLMSVPKGKSLPGKLEQLKTQLSKAEWTLWSIQEELFHNPIPEDLTLDRLKIYFDRPFNLLGQVPNTLNDLGGTPTFVHHNHRIEKICIEVPHVSESDQIEFLKNPSKATHFNPVFVAAEIPDEEHYYSNRNQDYWILAKKMYRGKNVCYVETVLYELLGNSQLANCIFVEVPRTLFNPHKTPQDARGRTIDTWKKH